MVFTELLPVAVLPPVVAAAMPSLETLTVWLLLVPPPKGLNGVKVGAPGAGGRGLVDPRLGLVAGRVGLRPC